MMKIIFLALTTFMFATQSVNARSVRDVLGDELKREHPGVEVLNLSSREIDNLDGLSLVALRYPDLKELYLDDNKLTEIPGGTFLAFGNLLELELSDNLITHLYDGAHAITIDYVLAGERGERMPLSSLAGLKALESLTLTQNNLSRLPESFGHLTNLTELQLSSNELASLPESFGRLTALQWLHLGNNQLTNLPQSLGQLTSLQSLTLGGNRLGEVYNLPAPHVTPLALLLRGLPLRVVDLTYNNLAPGVVGAVRRALPMAEVLLHQNSMDATAPLGYRRVGTTLRRHWGTTWHRI